MIKHHFIHLSVVITLGSMPFASARTSEFSIDRIELKNDIRSLVENGKLPSLQAAVISRDKIIFSEIFGTGSGRNTMYMIGSIQKVFTATAVMQLYEKKRLRIDDDVNLYLPFHVRNPRYPDVPVTIGMLLSHRSGLEMFKNQVEWDTRFLNFRKDGTSGSMPDAAFLSQPDFLKASLDRTGANFDSSVWHFKPGTNYIYSVSAQYILFCLIEKISGQTYSAYMHENIFKPLEMNNTMFYKDDSTADFAIPYERKDSINVKLPFWAGERDFICSTAEDLARFMIAHMNKGRYKNHQLLEPGTIALMREKHSPGKDIFHLSSNCPFKGYGLGIIQYSGDCFGHGGSTFGFLSLWCFNNSQKRGYVILTNINGILYGGDNFNSVWGTVSSVEKAFKTGIGLSRIDWKIYLIIACFVVGAFTYIIYFRLKFPYDNRARQKDAA